MYKFSRTLSSEKKEFYYKNELIQTGKMTLVTKMFTVNVIPPTQLR